MTVKIPTELQHLRKDHRGLPVPYTVLVKDGCPHFKVNCEVLTEKCIDKKLCIICGKQLKKDMWLIGGAKSAFHPRGVFVDAPMHKVCGVFSLKICPYLANTSYQARGLRMEELIKVNMPLLDQTQTADRLPFFVFVKIRGYKVSRASPLHRNIIPHKPYLVTEYWKDGRHATQEETAHYLMEVADELCNQLKSK